MGGGLRRKSISDNGEGEKRELNLEHKLRREGVTEKRY